MPEPSYLDTDPFPVDWYAWRSAWDAWRPSFEARLGVRRWNPNYGRRPFHGRNFLADEILGTWMLGAAGTDRSRLRPVELSEVTLTLGDHRRRFVGVTIDASGPTGETALAGSFAELDAILGPLAAGNPVP